MMEGESAGTLCDICCGLLEYMETNEGRLFETRPLHEDYESLQRSLRSDCALCATLPYDQASLDHDMPKIRYIKHDGYTHLYFEYNDGRKSYTIDHQFALCRVESDKALFHYSQEASIKTNTGTTKVLSVAREWMSRCVHGHDECMPKTQKPNQYPSRLLEIQEDAVRLVERGQHCFKGPYATLSHSWGGAHLKMLTSQTLPEFRNGITLRDLPPTFRDAICVARYLEIPYLWIDCYCILQSEGSRNDDQQHEIARMGEVYSNAILNIGAAAATSPMDGCFVQRKPKPPIRIKFTSKAYGSDQLYLLFDDKQLSKDYLEFVTPSQSSMFSRAWCMQERFLCPRMLHFCRTGLFWECNTVRLASDKLPIDYVCQARGANSLPPFSISGKQGPRSSSDYSVDWSEIVKGYSAMELSSPVEDKFVACGGVAKVMAELIDDEYVAGFFRRDLVANLSWMRMERKPPLLDSSVYRMSDLSESSPSPPSLSEDSSPETESSLILTSTAQRPKTVQKLKPWRAPSWSWASLDCEISFPGPSSNLQMSADIVALDCKLVDPSNPYGALSSGTITLRGWTIDSEIDWHRSGNAFAHRGKFYVNVTHDDADADDPRENLVIFLTMLNDLELNFEPVSRVDGLVLAPVDNNSTKAGQTFRRVGSFWDEDISNETRQALTERVITII